MSKKASVILMSKSKFTCIEEIVLPAVAISRMTLRNSVLVILTMLISSVPDMLPLKNGGSIKESTTNIRSSCQAKVKSLSLFPPASCVDIPAGAGDLG